MLLHWLMYFGGGFIAGGLNAIAGGGSLLLFPLLIGSGLSAMIANTTMSLIVQPGTLTAAYAFRHHLKKIPKLYYLLLLPCIVGGAVGAVMLTDTRGSAFEFIALVFMVIAIALLVWQPAIHAWTFRERKLKGKHIVLLGLVSVAFFVASVYGGYFGAGFGIIVLGLLGLTPIRDIRAMNGFKCLAALCLGVADCSYFIAHHLVAWHILPLFILGNTAGGYFSARWGSKLPANQLRILTIVLAMIATAYLAFKFYA